MKVIKPVVILEADLISSTVDETDYADYNPLTDYAVGLRVDYGHKVWESVQTPNIGHTPGTDALYWAEKFPTNRWAMFDAEISTATTSATPLTVVVAPGLVDSLALLDIDATEVTITARDGVAGPVVYEYNQMLDGSEVLDWYQYFYQPFTPIREVVLTNLPLYGDIHITVTLTSGGTISVATLVFGTATFLGISQYGATVGILDYSRKETSPTGVTTLLKRKFSKRMTMPLDVKNYDLNNLFRILSDLRATPCVWVGVESAGYSPLTIFGFYRDFSIDVTYVYNSFCNIEIEGLA